MPRRQARDVETDSGLVWTELRKGVPSCVVVSFPSRPQRIISVPVCKAELAQQLLELCRSNSSLGTEDLKKLCRDHKRSLANLAPGTNSKKDIKCSEKSGKPTQIDGVSAGRSKDSKKHIRCNAKPGKPTQIDAVSAGKGKDSKKNIKCCGGVSKTTQINAVKTVRSKDSKKSIKFSEELSKTTQIDAVKSATSTNSQRSTEDTVGGGEFRKTTEIDSMKSATSIDSKKNTECGKELNETKEANAAKSTPCRDFEKDTECGAKTSKAAQEDSMEPALGRDSKENAKCREEHGKATEVHASSLRKKRIEVDAPSLRDKRKKAKKTTQVAQANLERWFQRSTCSPSELSQCQGGSSSADLSLTQMLGEVMDMDELRVPNQQAPKQAGDGAEIPLTQMLTEIMMDMSQQLADVSHPCNTAGQSTGNCSADPKVETSISTGKVASFGKPRRRRGKDTRKLGRHSLKGQPSLRSKKATQTTLVF